LWGIVPTSLRVNSEEEIPSAVRRWTVDKWWSGISYIHIVAREDGELRDFGDRSRSHRVPFWKRLRIPFWKFQTITVGNESYTRIFPASFGTIQSLCAAAGDRLELGRFYRKGETIVKLKVVAGDHLFVNRMIYNFRSPHRGEIVVFSSEGMRDLIQDTHYIKRLVALSGEAVRIGDDRHLVIDGKRLDAGTPGFENVYSFDPQKPPRRNEYSGHVNGTVGSRYPGYNRRNFQYFPDESTVFNVPEDHFLAIGDNTMNSHDGRAWGAVPQEKLVGRAGFVFWPVSDRFGWGYR
jgi:signal peptidase I